MRRTAILAIGVFLLAGAAWAQETLWVTSAGARLKADTRATAATVAEVPVGTELTVLSSEGTWYEVSTADGARGWIYRGKVSASAPEASGTEGGGGLFGAITGSRIEAGAADTSRSIRGLSPETTQYAENAGTPKQYRAALDRVLERQIPEAELERFLAEGHIGEYAR